MPFLFASTIILLSTVMSEFKSFSSYSFAMNSPTVDAASAVDSRPIESYH